MKAFLVSILAAAATLVLAVFLFSPSSPTAADRTQRLAPVAAAAETNDVQPQHAAPTKPAEVMPPREPTKEPFSPMPTQLAEEPTATASKNDETLPNIPSDSKLSTADKLTLAQTATTDTSLRNADYPRTYISAIQVDLESPMHAVKLTWSGPQAASQETGPFHSSPGRGLGSNNCDDPAESIRQDSNCTPEGTFRVQGFSNTMPTYSHCKFVTWFLLTRGIGLHSYPDVPDYPASHGCVRLDEHTAQLIHNNTKIGATEVTVAGKWTFGR